MCAIGYFLERAGLMTTGIALVRENAEHMMPPRSLWVPFPLGRPLGAPNDPAFQHRVIAAALGLLEAERGPVLEDFPEDAPPGTSQTAPACPVSFATASDDGSWHERLRRELAALDPWYTIGRRRRGGRTLVGVSDLSVAENVAELARYLDEGRLPTGALRWFKHAIEDTKAYYVEALTAQPGDYDQRRVYDTIWFDTQFGLALRVFHDGFAEHPTLHAFARIVLPRDALSGNSRSRDALSGDTLSNDNDAPGD